MRNRRLISWHSWWINNSCCWRRFSCSGCSSCEHFFRSSCRWLSCRWRMWVVFIFPISFIFFLIFYSKFFIVRQWQAGSGSRMFRHVFFDFLYGIFSGISDVLRWSLRFIIRRGGGNVHRWIIFLLVFRFRLRLFICRLRLIGLYYRWSCATI